MIDVTESVMTDGAHWFEVWSDLGGKNHILAAGRDKVFTLVTAERVLRRELDDLQGKLHEARTAQKAEA